MSKKEDYAAIFVTAQEGFLIVKHLNHMIGILSGELENQMHPPQRLRGIEKEIEEVKTALRPFGMDMINKRFNERMKK